MEWFTAFVLFVLIWWTVLFAVLPFGTRPVEHPDEQTGWRGAPTKPMIGRKMLVTTLVAVVLWTGAMVIIKSDWISFRPAPSPMGDN